MKARIYLMAGACVLALLGAAASVWSAGAAAPAWPEVSLPPGVEAFSMGEQISMDGLPMRMQGFHAASSPEQTAAWFRQHMERPLVENQLGNRLVLGRARGAYYITVQLAADGQGTRGVVAVSDVAAALTQRAASRTASERVLARLPSGTKVLGALNSNDAGRSASYLALSNSYSEEINRERVLSLLRDDGMELERESRAADAGAAVLAGLPSGTASGRLLFFKGRGREAVAVISRLPDQRVSIVLNTVTTMEAYQ
jgi:hypothetical protein